MSKAAAEALVEGTTIPKNRMAAMMAHSKALLGEAADSGTPGDQLIEEPEIDHATIARNLQNARPSLLDDINEKINGKKKKKKNESRRRRRTEGVQGTSPSPGQDQDLGFIPPTTSMVTNPGVLGGEDAEEEVIGEDPGEEHPNEEVRRNNGTDYLFAEEDEDDDGGSKKKNPFAKKDDDDSDEDDGDDDADDEDDSDEDDSEDDDSEDSDEDEGGKNESVEVHCEKCGYEEEYNLNEEDMASNPPPMTTEGQLDTTCPMCGADMDFSLVGATDQEKIGDETPMTDPRGNGGDGEAPVEAVHYARHLMHRLGEGEDISTLVQEVISSDFLPRNYRFFPQARA